MSKYINLINKLSDTDKEIIETYIAKYGCRDKDFIGVDKWLKNWSHANQKLYHLLGDTFIKEYPYTYTKPSYIVRKDIQMLLFDSLLKYDYHNFYWDFIKEQDYIDEKAKHFFNHLLDVENFINEKIDLSLKIKKPNAKKILQIQAGTKPIKAIGKVIEYFKDDFHFNDNALENFRKKYAIIQSEKTIKGKYCISIHPMDFLTMSDNNSNWSSCMSWVSDGCYHIGTVEMMNSNNVLCAYLLSGDSHYIFDSEKINPETGEIIGDWNNKRWRQLFYITKDIIMGGKPYPYASKELTLEILNKIKELANNNLDWNYSFGPELYQDMAHICSDWHMTKQREWMRYEKKNPVKHNIIWDTKGMYNDMINDHVTEYWCYRNKVNHTKIISVSGKAPCLCCGGSVIDSNYGYEDYNDRYDSTGNVVCFSCLDKKYTCDCCGVRDSKIQYTQLKNGRLLCKDCLKMIRICPCCGEVFYLNWGNELSNYVSNPYLYKEVKKNPNIITDQTRYRFIDPVNLDSNTLKDDLIFDSNKSIYCNFERLYVHAECKSKILSTFKQDFIEASFRRSWSEYKDVIHIVSPTLVEKYRVQNLLIPDLSSIVAIDTELAT